MTDPIPLRRRKPRAWSIVDAVTSYYGFAVDGGDVVAILLAEGAETATERGTETYTGDGSLIAVARDSAGYVDDGWCAWRTDAGGIAVWDVAGETVHTWSDEDVAIVSAPMYAAGYLYWWGGSGETSGATSVTVTLWRARCDLTGATEMLSESVAVSPSFGVWTDARAVASTASARAELVYEDPNPDGSWPVHVSAALGGGSFDDDTGSLGISTSADHPAGPPLSGLAAALVDGLGEDRQVGQIGTDLDDEPLALWPTTGDWWVDGGFDSLSISADGLQLVAVSPNAGLAVRGNVSGLGTPVQFSISELDPIPTHLVPVPED